MLDVNPFKAGNIYFCEIHGKSNIMTYNKSRPVLIVNTISLSDGGVMVAPITSRKDKNGIKCKLKDDCISTIAIERMMPVSINNLTRFIGNISDDIMNEVKHAINLMFNGGSEEEMDKYFPFRTKYNVHITKGPKNIFIDNIESVNISGSKHEHINSDEVLYDTSMYMFNEQIVSEIEPVVVTIGGTEIEPGEPTPEPEPTPEQNMIDLKKINHKPLIKAQTYTTIMDIVNESNIKSYKEVMNTFKYNQLKSRLNQYEKHYQDVIITGVIRGLQTSDIYKLIETGSINSDFFNIEKPFNVNTHKVFTVNENMEIISEDANNKTKKKKVFIKLSEMSHNELLWISNAEIKEVAERLNVCIATARKHKVTATNMLAQ